MQRKKSEDTAKEILDYLKRNNKQIFKAKWLAKDLGMGMGRIGMGIRVLKEQGKIERLGAKTWILKD